MTFMDETHNDHVELSHSLEGQLLVATPQMTDERFKQKAIFVCKHDGESSMGLIINQPHLEVSLEQVMEQLKIDSPRFALDDPIYVGGPVEPQRGYILHTSDHMMPDSVTVTEDISLSVHVDMITEISRGLGPRMFKIMLGYAGWSAGQLEDELKMNMWFHLNGSPATIFATRNEQVWDSCFNQLGINAGSLSSQSGTA